MKWNVNTWRYLPVMEIKTFCKELSEALEHLETPVVPGSLVARAGAEITGIAQCYLDDGKIFLGKDDPVNALASFAYASAWLDAGCYIGVCKSKPLCRNLLSCTFFYGDHVNDKLVEKTCRYEQLLDRAIQSSEPGPEAGTRWHEGGTRVITIATAYLNGGSMFQRNGRNEDALSCFSYGHGWLDAGIRLGLIRITGNRDLFAI